MIQGIGIDLVEINRFALWHTFSDTRLRRIFSEQEVKYCRAVPVKSAERFAVRFAAREAFFKALGHRGSQSVPFLTVCKKVWVVNGDRGAPYLMVDWEGLMGASKAIMQPFLSLSHTGTVATAMVILQEIGEK